MPREELYLAQTPQVFERSCCAGRTGSDRGPAAKITDDCQLVEALGHRCAIVESSPLNIKITTPLDLKLAAAILPLLENRAAKPRRTRSRTSRSMWGDLPKLKPSDLFGGVRSLRLVEHRPEGRLHGVGPDAVALGAQVQVVGHDLG